MTHMCFSVSFITLADPWSVLTALSRESSSSSPPGPAAGPALASPGGSGRWAQNKVWQEGWRRSKQAQAVLCSSCKVAAPRAQAAPIRREYLTGEAQQQPSGACHGCREMPHWETPSSGLWSKVTVRENLLPEAPGKVGW